MDAAVDPEEYFDNVLNYAEPGTARLWTPGPAERWHTWWTGQLTDASALSALARDQGFVLTTPQLRTCGISRQHARSRVGRGRWIAAARGVVAPVNVRDPDPFVEGRRRHAVCAAAAALTHADHVVCGRSSAILRGLPTFGIPPQPELIDAEPAGLGRRTGSHVYGGTLTIDDVTTWFGVPVTTIARTIVDLARHDRRDAIMAVDAALSERLVRRAELRSALEQARGWPGVRQARAVLELADERAESPLESVTRLTLIEDGFPTPDLQVRLGPYRVDLLFRQWGLIVEVDGMGKYSDAEMRREKRREMRLRAMGYRVERVTWDDVVHHWQETRARLLQHAPARLPA